VPMGATSKACMYCAEQIQAAAVVCRFCNREQVAKKPPGHEEVIFEGTATHRAYAPLYFFSAVMCVFVVGFPMLVATYLMVRMTRWRITDRRIQVEKGVLTRTVDSLDLWRVRDLRFVHYPFFGNGEVHIVSTDASTPVVVARGLPDPRTIYERLKQAVDEAKRERRVMAVDQ